MSEYILGEKDLRPHSHYVFGLRHRYLSGFHQNRLRLPYRSLWLHRGFQTYTSDWAKNVM